MAWVNLFKNPLNITPLLISSWSDTIRNALQFGRARCQRREPTHQQHKTDLIWTCSPSGGHTEKRKNIYTFKIYLVKGTICITCKKKLYCKNLEFLLFLLHSNQVSNYMSQSHDWFWITSNQKYRISFFLSHPRRKGPCQTPSNCLLCNICMRPYVSVLWYILWFTRSFFLVCKHAENFLIWEKIEFKS